MCYGSGDEKYNFGIGFLLHNSWKASTIQFEPISEKNDIYIYIHITNESSVMWLWCVLIHPLKKKLDLTKDELYD